MLTCLKRGDAVLNAKRTENLLSMSENPNGYIQRQIRKLNEESAAERGMAVGGNTENVFNLDMTLNHVTDFNDIINKLAHSSEYERLFEAMLGTKMTGKNRMGKYLI